METNVLIWTAGGTAAVFAAAALRRRLATQAQEVRRRAQLVGRRGRAPRPADPGGGYWQVGGATRAAAKRRKRA